LVVALRCEVQVQYKVKADRAKMTITKVLFLLAIMQFCSSASIFEDAINDFACLWGRAIGDCSCYDCGDPDGGFCAFPLRLYDKRSPYRNYRFATYFGNECYVRRWECIQNERKSIEKFTFSGSLLSISGFKVIHGGECRSDFAYE